MDRGNVPKRIKWTNQVISGEMSGTDFLFKYCDGKFTDEDLNDEGNFVTAKYYGDDGYYLDDYASQFGDLMYKAPESAHDFADYCKVIEGRLQSGSLVK